MAHYNIVLLTYLLTHCTTRLLPTVFSQADNRRPGRQAYENNSIVSENFKQYLNV